MSDRRGERRIAMAYGQMTGPSACFPARKRYRLPGRVSRAKSLGPFGRTPRKENVVMSPLDSDSRADSDRRAFLAQVGAGTLALLGTPALLGAESLVSSSPFDDKWVDNLKGRYRQYFDGVTVNDGFPLGFAMNWMDTMKSTYNLTDKDLNAVVGLRHFAIPIAYTDAIWAKYKLGEFAKVMDPATKQPATRNIYFNSKPGDVMLPGMSIDKLQPRGVTFVVCNVAHT